MDTDARSHRWGRHRIVPIILFVLVVASTVAPIVSAHAVISETDPSQGGHVQEVPETITMTFTSGVDEIRDVTVRGPDGEDVTVDVSKAGDVSKEITVEIDAAGDGIYTVEWSIISADTHPTSGEWFFTAGDQPPDPVSLRAAYEAEQTEGSTDDSIEYTQILPTGLLYTAVMVLIGLPVVLFVALRPVGTRFDLPMSDSYAVVSTLLIGASGSIVPSTGLLFVDSVANTGSSLDAVTTTAASLTGSVLLTQLLIAIAVTSFLVYARRRERQHWDWLVCAGGGGIAIAAGLGWTSHTASQAGRLVGTVFTLGHLAGAAAWVGGLCAVAVLLPRLLNQLEEASQRTIATAVLRRFSILAMAGVTLLVTTGLGLTAWLVPTPGAVFSTLHGSVLGVKLLLVTVALGLGASSRLILVRRLDPTVEDAHSLGDRFWNRGETTDRGEQSEVIGTVIRTVRFEVVIVVCVLLLSGALTATVPGVTATADSDPERTQEQVELETDDLDGTLTLLPVSANETAENRFDVSDGTPVVVELQLVRDGDPVELASTERVIATHDDSGTTIDPAFEPIDDPGSYGTVVLLPENGTWNLRLNVWTGETYLDDSVEIHTVSAKEQAAGDERDEPLFGNSLWLLAVLAGLLGGVALSLEIRRFEPASE